MAASATYGDDPANSSLDQVRLLIGDTVCADALLSDNEILFFITECGNAAYAAVKAAEAIAGQFARSVTTRTGQVSKSLSDRMQHYLDLASRLQVRADAGAGSVAAPIFTALTEADKDVDRDDPNTVQPQFRIGQDDNPRQGADRVDDTLLNP